MYYNRNSRQELRKKLEFYKADPVFNFRIDEETALKLLNDLDELDMKLRRRGRVDKGGGFENR